MAPFADQRPWKAVAPAQVLWETWEDEHFVFNPRSGETHVLNALAGAMLRALAERPLRIAELAEGFRGQLAQGSAEDNEQAVAALIGQLDQLGLVEPLES